MTGLPGFASDGSGLHLAAGCQQWKLLNGSDTQPLHCDQVVNFIIISYICSNLLYVHMEILQSGEDPPLFEDMADLICNPS